MAPSSRVVINRAALDEAVLAVADGLAELGQRIVEVADPPDAPAYGQGLVTTGGTYAAVNGKKIAGNAAKPRSAPKAGILVVAGFSFPGRFQETGTVHHRAQPFLMPAVNAVVPNAESVIGPAVKRRIGHRP
jgi:hypothetical protein